MTCYNCGTTVSDGSEHYITNTGEAYCAACGDRRILSRKDFPVEAFLRDIQRMLKIMEPTKGNSWQSPNQQHIDHALQHLREYLWKVPYDKKEIGTDRKWHLISAACRLMFEYWHETQKL